MCWRTEQATGASYAERSRPRLTTWVRIQRTLAWYERESWDAARRYGWRPEAVSAALFLLCSTDNDARVKSNRELLAQTFPVRARALGAFLAAPGMLLPARGLAMIDPRARRVAWLRPTASDGRRSRAPYADNRAAAIAMR
jgi:hypothetical protein